MTFLGFSGLINFTTCVILGFLVLLRDPKSVKNRSYFYLNSSVALYSFGYFIWQLCNNEIDALFWFKILVIGVILINVTYLHFVFAFVEILKRKRKELIIYYLVNIGFILLNINSLLYTNVEPRYGLGFWPTPTNFFHIYLAFWFWQCFYGFSWLLRGLRATSGVRREQIKYFIISAIFGFTGGATNWLMWYKIYLPPYLNISISVYIGIVAWAIIRYKFMNLDLAVRKVLSFLGYVLESLVIFIPLLILVHNNLTFTIMTSLLIILVSPLLFKFLSRYNRAVIDKILYRGKFGYLEKVSHSWDNPSGEQYTSFQIAEKLVYEDVDIIGLKSAGFWLYDNYRKLFKPIVQAGLDRTVSLDFGIPSFTEQDSFIRVLLDARRPILKEDFDLNNISLRETVDNLQVEVVFPLFTEDRLIGFFILGPKENNEMFHIEDINVLRKQVEVAQNHLSHTIFMEERASFSRKLAHDMKNLFGKAIEPTIQDLLEAKDEKERDELIGILVSQLKFLKESLRNNFDLISILERLVKRTYTLLPEDLGEIVSRSISLYKVAFSEKGISLEIDIPDSFPNVLVNREDISKVFNNLLDNSLKFTQKGMVLIKAEQKGNEALISFSDTGLGMDKEDLEYIFEPKVKADDENVGTGLGLTIVRDIIEEHKGNIWVESSKGCGTTFYFTLPLAGA